ncbi:hypothetical protein MO973_12610 [Paenibacillus sp. TRM 82003]|nr:hypothetical protein [Paenibacillus sp. TRM 82003]
MSDQEQQLWDKFIAAREKAFDLFREYSLNYSDYETPYFWANLGIVLIPLAVYLWRVDKQRIFEISFFAFNVHVLWAYTDIALSTQNVMIHPHTLFWFLPIGFSQTASLVPIASAFAYQWATNRGANVYLWLLIVGVFLTGFAMLSTWTELLLLRKWMNHVYLTIIGIAISFLAYWMTLLFLKLRKGSPS